MAERGEDAPKSADTFPVPARTALLILASSLTVAAAWRVTSSQAPLVSLSQLPASALLVGLIALGQWRNPLIALLCALAPLIGCLWASAIFDALARPGPFFAGPFAFGAVLSILFADVFVVRALKDEGSRGAAFGLYRALAGSSVAALAPFLAVALVARFLLDDRTWTLAASDATAAAVSSAAIFALFPPAAAFLRINDFFVTQTNRLLERRVTLAYRATFVAGPRWSTSVAGICVVLAVLGWFGGSSVVLGGVLDVRTLLLAAPLLLLASAFVSGAWREALGSFLALAVVASLGTWAWARLMPVAAAATARLDDGLAVASLLVLFVAARTRRFAKSEDLSVARARAIEEMSATILFATLAALAAFLPSFRAAQALLAIVIVLAGGFAALVFAPAFAAALETNLPKRRTVEELYGRRAG